MFGSLLCVILLGSGLTATAPFAGTTVTSLPSTLLTSSSVAALVTKSVDQTPAAAGTDQAFLQRTIRATYYYTCRNAPNRVRYFEWHAGYDIQNQRIYIHGVAHIDRVDDIDTSNPPSFSTRWYGTLCTELPDQYCTYTFSGRTEGTVSPTGIAMSLVTDSTNISERPWVKEDCFPRHIGMTTCPVVPMASMTMCAITNIVVGIGH